MDCRCSESALMLDADTPRHADQWRDKHI
jgi:hypothetical protein